MSRLALDRLRAAQRRRESYVGPWLPEPVVAVDEPTGPGADPAHLAEMAESLTFGFLRVLESLTPIERVVFVLADVFGVPVRRDRRRGRPQPRRVPAGGQPGPERGCATSTGPGPPPTAPSQVADALVAALDGG